MYIRDTDPKYVSWYRFLTLAGSSGAPKEVKLEIGDIIMRLWVQAGVLKQQIHTKNGAAYGPPVEVHRLIEPTEHDSTEF